MSEEPGPQVTRDEVSKKKKKEKDWKAGEAARNFRIPGDTRPVSDTVLEACNEELLRMKLMWNKKNILGSVCPTKRDLRETWKRPEPEW